MDRQADGILIMEKSGGKGRVARAVDRVAAFAACFLLLFVLLSLLTDSYSMSLLIAILLTLLFSLATARVIMRVNASYIDRRRELVAIDMALRELASLPFDVAASRSFEILKAHGVTDAKLTGQRESCRATYKGDEITVRFIRIPPECEITACDIASLRGMGRVALVTTGTIDPALVGFARDAGVELVIDRAAMASKELPEKLLPGDDEVSRHIVESQKKKRGLRFREASAFDRARARLFLSSGAMLLVSSFFVINPLYYRLSSAALLSISLLSLGKRLFLEARESRPA